jgi:hypothetical protein
MTILSVVKDVCAAVGVMVPTSLFSGLQSNRTMQEMLALANEMAQRIAYDTRDWTMVKALQVYTGDGAQTDWPLPANYKRMPKTANVWSSANTGTPLLFIPDPDEWIQRRLRNYTITPGEWMLMGGNMIIYPALGAGTTARFAYFDKNCVVLHGAPGQYGDTFQNDDDTYRLDERLLKLGMIWQWRENKGSPYAEAMGTYSDAIANAMGADTPSPIIIDRQPASRAMRASVAYPWPVPT